MGKICLVTFDQLLGEDGVMDLCVMRALRETTNGEQNSTWWEISKKTQPEWPTTDPQEALSLIVSNAHYIEGDPKDFIRNPGDTVTTVTIKGLENIFSADLHWSRFRNVPREERIEQLKKFFGADMKASDEFYKQFLEIITQTYFELISYFMHQKTLQENPEMEDFPQIL